MPTTICLPYFPAHSLLDTFENFLNFCYTPIQKAPFGAIFAYILFTFGTYKIFTLADNFKAIHIWAKHGRYDNRPIFLLIIFHDSSYRSSNSKPRPVQCMNKFRLIPLMPAEADICPACLKIKTVGARGNFSILLLPWHPHFDIISFC